MNDLVNKFKALGDETRFKLFLLLSKKQICVKSLAQVLGISESAVSQHLKVLRDAGLIRGEKVGYFTHYQVQKSVLKQLQGIIGELSDGITGLDEDLKKLENELSDCIRICQKESELCGDEN